VSDVLPGAEACANAVDDVPLLDVVPVLLAVAVLLAEEVRSETRTPVPTAAAVATVSARARRPTRLRRHGSSDGGTGRWTGSGIGGWFQSVPGTAPPRVVWEQPSEPRLRARGAASVPPL
jgi:hypothetical protein